MMTQKIQKELVRGQGKVDSDSLQCCKVCRAKIIPRRHGEIGSQEVKAFVLITVRPRWQRPSTQLYQL